MCDEFAGRGRDSQSSSKMKNALHRSQELPAARCVSECEKIDRKKL